ncbi:hypothetical protein GTQ40_06290 [Flavobacteriaceae bacterium R38]|nr:hypothetical protein [Flavobacteriaceae bacterium R38]
MKIEELKAIQDIEANQRTVDKYNSFSKLLDELRAREIPGTVIEIINKEISLVNAASHSDKSLSRRLTLSQSKVLSVLASKLKIVRKGYYRNLWMVLGMSSFGLPIGLSFGLALDNIGLLGVGLPIGMAVGLAMGSAMDKKAAEKGNQLSF